MKNIGIIIMALGIALFAFVVYNFIKESNRTLSPVPQDKGVKVIFVTPTE